MLTTVVLFHELNINSPERYFGWKNLGFMRILAMKLSLRKRLGKVLTIKGTIPTRIRKGD